MNLVDAVRTALVRVGFLAGRLMPLRSQVLLATAHADQIGGNLAWIREGIQEQLDGVPVIEFARRSDPALRRLPRQLLDALVAGFRLATSRLTVVDDYFFPMYVVRPRPGTTFVQVWHACGALKRFGHSLGDRRFGSARRRSRGAAIHRNYDLCLVSAARFIPFYAEAFATEPQRFTSRIGIPRTDLFFDPARSARAAAAVRGRYAIPTGRRIVLYAPTFRGDSISRARAPERLDMRVLQRALGADHVLLSREHPFVRSAAPDPDLAGFVIDASRHEDVNELMLVADVLITDYSSVLFEFALLGRPMVFFAPDHDAYESERGFYVDYATYVPGPVFIASEDLAAHLRAGSFDLDRVRQFAVESFDVADGQATRRFVDEVARPALGAAAAASFR